MTQSERPRPVENRLSRTLSEASTDTVLAVGHERSPLGKLLRLATSVGEDQTTDGVAETVSAVRVELAAFVTALDLELGEL